MTCECPHFKYHGPDILCKHIIKHINSINNIKQDKTTPDSVNNIVLNTNIKLEETTNVKTDIYTINSFTNPDKQYIVEYIKKTNKLTCECPHFKYHGPDILCKHMKNVMLTKFNQADTDYYVSFCKKD